MAAFATQIEMTVRAGERAFPHTLVAPNEAAGPKLLADPAFPIRVTVKVIADSYYAAMMVDHDFVRVDLVCLIRIAGFADMEQIAADAVTRTHVHIVVVKDWRGHGGRLALASRAPQHLAAFGLNADDILARELDILPHAADLRGNRRRVFRRVRQFFRLPQQLTGFLVERRDRTLRAAGSADQPVAVHQRRFAVHPAAAAAPELLFETPPPYLLAGGNFETNQIPKLVEHIDPISVHGGRAARAGRIAACFANFRRPDRAAAGHIEGDGETRIALFAQCENLCAGHGHPAVPGARSPGFPNQRGASRRPLFQQALLRGNVIAVRSAPLRPVRCRQKGGGQIKRKTCEEDVFRLHE